jgi:oligopeptidase B
MYSGCNSKVETDQAPVAKKVPVELTIHGDTRIDNYYWLNQREDPDVLEYIVSENNYTKRVMQHTDNLQQDIYEEIIGRIKQKDESVPYKLNGYYYYKKYEEGKEYPIYARKLVDQKAAEEILLNVNEMAEGYDYYWIKGLSVSDNNQFLVFGVDTVSRRQYDLYIKDLRTGTISNEGISNTDGDAVWASDNKTLFYTVKDSTLREYKIFRHKRGTPSENDIEIFHEKENTFSVYVSRSKSRKYIFISSWSTLATEHQFLDAGDPNGTFRVVSPREKNHEYWVYHHNDQFYIITNDKAKNFRLVLTNVDNPGKSNWKEIIPHRENALVEDLDLFKNYLVVSERIKGLTQIRIINRRDDIEHYLDFGEESYSAFPIDNYEFDTDTLRFSFTSLATPKSVYDYNMNSREKKLQKQDDVLGSFSPENYQTERHLVIARDGKEIPLSIVYKKGIPQDGNNPCLLYGYGSYGYSEDPDFKSSRLSLIDRGFIYAIAHIRGGQELGRSWYEDGKLLKKKNTFYDFIDCSEYLIKKNYTNTQFLFGMGGSAGGLLIGAVANMTPQLFKGLIAEVPWVDVVTTMLDSTIPLTTSEYDEWGNPNNKEYYDYMLSYSPYDNVAQQDYPAMLVTTGLHDSQVQYWEPVKWIAKLRDMKTDNNMLILNTQMDAGHGGASGRFEKYKEVALEYAFMLDQLNKKE